MNLTLLHGPHSFARKRAKEARIKKYIAANGSNVTFLRVPSGTEAPSSLPVKISQRLASPSLFGQKEMLILVFSDLSPAPARNKGKSSRSLAVLDSVVPYLSNIPVAIELLLEVPIELPASSRLVQAVKEQKGEIELFNLPPVKDKTVLRQEIQKYLREEKINLDWYLVQKIIDAGGGDWWFVWAALEQAALLLRALNKSEDNEKVAQLLNLEEEKNIFQLFDAIGSGDKAKAFNLAYENSARNVLASGKDIEQVLGFISLMARQIRQMIGIKSGLTPAEAQKEWRIPIFVFNKLKSQAACFSLEFLSHAYEKLAELSEKAKRGLYSPLSLVDFFIFYFTSHRQPPR